MTATTDIVEAAQFGEILLVVIPTPFVARVVEQLRDVLRPDQILVSCTKGILNDTLETPHDILKVSSASCSSCNGRRCMVTEYLY